ncbi:family 16 glycoside hydrolase [Algoriphagus sp. D3-2-R+10]|uniref:family 16 glycoside hydrolase n=1 Tax=Algoriphagus aurantiacus TaxID=3103948 RepID=UPI002B3D58CC|nr:family 16 glycoside hydrolase [Algoriphagus sp. D3-2-R+10]MEB2775537.1 family 16 glycoside hydrolase [Algoriphagus sp. D3-2-R+10]
MNTKTFLICCCLMIKAIASEAQESPIPYNVLPLQNLSEFQPTSENWTIVEDVFYDLNGGKSKITNGTGILLNTIQKGGGQAIKTSFEHGDIELELDFMMPKGSNSGIYLQGRYEIQLFDSWAVQDPKFSDAGAIYQRWDASRGNGREGYEGHPPLVNVSRSPGLWQSMRIMFRAPRFDSQGQKVSNAKFISVHQNGVLVQKNIEVTGPTQGTFFEDEQALGPLVIQGDHGGVAIRDISYKIYGSENVSLTDMKLTYYDSIKTINDFANANPKGEMNIDVLAHLAPATRNEFSGTIEGTLTVPSAGEYFFNLNLAWVPDDTPPGRINGAGKLFIDEKEVVYVDGVTGKANGSTQLTAGVHKIKLNYFKTFGHWYAPSNDITLTVEGNGIAKTALNVPLRADDPVGQIEVRVNDKAEMQRGFIMHHGEKRTHTVAVGEPGGVNYTIDLSRGELLNVWRGDFVETTPMWYGRGETQLMLPLGNVIEFGGKPSLAVLSSQDAAWPDEIEDFTFEGYELKKGGTPVINYDMPGVAIRQTLDTKDFGKKLVHTLSVVTESDTEQIYCLVAQGANIEKLPNGLYAIDDKSYYIEFEGKTSAIVRNAADGSKELILPVKLKDRAGMVTYSIVW